MSNVWVKRELLEQLRNFTFLRDDGCAGALRGNIDKALAAQPAEAEGVEVVGWLHGYAKAVSSDPVVVSGWLPECVDPLMTVAQHRRILSAVTAERDRLESMLIRTTTRHFAQQWKDRADDKKLDECLSEGIAMLEAERDRLRDQVKALQSDSNSWQSGYDKGRHDGTKHRHSEVGQLRAEVEALREKAGKYATIERVMKMLECDEREGGIWTACTLLLIGSAHKMNSAKSVVDQEGVTVAAENLGNWRVTVERIDAAMAAKEA